jgi:hypothetical protein
MAFSVPLIRDIRTFSLRILRTLNGIFSTVISAAGFLAVLRRRLLTLLPNPGNHETGTDNADDTWNDGTVPYW